MNNTIPPQLIINADDFGYSREVNRAIIDLLLSSRIDRTTIMVNMEYADDAVSIVKENALSEKVGLHLNLAEGIPLSQKIKNTCFCADGHFIGTQANPSYRYYIKRSLRKVIMEELDLQFKKYHQYFGYYPKHVDSHGHFHNFFPYFFIIRKLAKKYNVGSMRIGINLYNKTKASVAKKLYKWALNTLIKFSFTHTDYMGSWLEFRYYYKPKKSHRKKTVEIMTHPTYSGGEIVDIVYEKGTPFTNFSEISKNV